VPATASSSGLASNGNNFIVGGLGICKGVNSLVVFCLGCCSQVVTNFVVGGLDIYQVSSNSVVGCLGHFGCKSTIEKSRRVLAVAMGLI
jgi:hypothetical protein